jgi:hypothetical protein
MGEIEMITIEMTEDLITGDRIFKGVVPRKDLMDIQLDNFDRMVVNSPETSAADVFQTLEILARRQQEQLGDSQ